MPEVEPLPTTPRKERILALVTPREHGAWGMMLVPLLVGGVVGWLRDGAPGPLFWLTACAICTFWLRTPVEALLGTTPLRAQSSQERTAVIRIAGALTLATLACLAMLLRPGNVRGLLALGSLCAAAFAAQALLKMRGNRFRMTAQLLGAISLTATGPAAYYLMTGRFDAVCWVLWVINWLFAANQIMFVQLRIHSARSGTWAERWAKGRVFLGIEIVLLGLLFAMSQVGWVSSWAILCFVPALWRGVAWFFSTGRVLNVRRLGWTELAHAVTFGVLFVASFRL